MSLFNRKLLEHLKANGKIRDFKFPEEKSAAMGERRSDVVKITKPKLTKAFKKLASDLHYFCQEQKLHLLVEYQFHEFRKYRFDFTVTDKVILIDNLQRVDSEATIKIAVEFEGGIWMKGGGAHSRPAAIERDIEKYNLAQSMHFEVIRFHAKNYKTVLQEIEKYLKC